MRVVVPGEIARDDLGIAFAHAGIVLGSFRDSRAIPAAVFDALSTGAPVITADTAAARELLHGRRVGAARPARRRRGARRRDRRGSPRDDELRTHIAARGREVFLSERAGRCSARAGSS